MTLDPERFNQQITDITNQVYNIRKLCNVSARNNELAYICVTGLDVDPDFYDCNTLSITGFPDYGSLSAHGKLALTASEDRINDLSREILTDLCKVAPALDSPNSSLSLRIGPRKRTGAQISLKLIEQPIGLGGNMNAPEMFYDHLACVLERLKDLPKGDRCFRFNDHSDIYAATPNDAYRIFTTLCDPTTPEADSRPPHSMSEMLDVETFRSKAA